MNEELNQRKAKILIRDYLRETGRKGLTSLMNDIRRHTGTEIFQKRTLELWLAEQERFLQDQNWIIVEKFIQSAHFKKHVPYLNNELEEKRLIRVAEGLTALYCEKKGLDGVLLFPSKIQAQGVEAVKLLEGNWETEYNLKGKKFILSEEQIDIICKVKSIPEKRYAKIAFINRMKTFSISVSGIAIYLSSESLRHFKYIHVFALQLWRRKDPLTGSLLESSLSECELDDSGPVFMNMGFGKKNFPGASDFFIGLALPDFPW